MVLFSVTLSEIVKHKSTRPTQLGLKPHHTRLRVHVKDSHSLSVLLSLTYTHLDTHASHCSPAKGIRAGLCQHCKNIIAYHSNTVAAPPTAETIRATKL